MNATSSKIFVPMLLAFFLVAGMVRADFVCEPTTITVEFLDLAETYSMGKAFTVTAKVYNVNPAYPVKGEIRDGSNLLVQSVDGWAQGDNTWKFTFNGIERSGSYTIKVFLQHPAPPYSVISKTQSFIVKEGLGLTYGINSYTQYLGEDIVSELTVTPADRPIIKTLTGKLNGFPVNVLAQFRDLGGGKWEAKVPGAMITTYGLLDLTVRVEDVAGEYEPREKTLTGITIAQSNFDVLLDVPSSASVGNVYDIKITTLRNNKAYEAERVELRVTYPGGGPGDLIETHEFSHVTGSNVYTYSMEFEYGQQHYFKASAWSELESDVIEKNVPVSGGGTCGCDEFEGTCQAGCTCDNDCGGSEPMNIWWIIGIVAVVLVVITILAVR